MDAYKVLILFLLSIISARCQYPNENFDDMERIREDPSKYRLPNDTVPLYYRVKLNSYVAPENVSLQGETSIVVKVLQETTTVTLHAKDLAINEAETTLTSEKNVTIRPIGHEYDDNMEMLRVNFMNPLNPGTYNLKLSYGAEWTGGLHGFYGSFYEDENDNTKWLLVTHLQPIFARRVFPCWDEPALKSIFKFSIKHDRNYTALSNMPAYKKETDNSDGKIWTHFQPTPLMSTNVLGFVVADYVNISNADGTMRLWTRKNAMDDARYMLPEVEKATEVLGRYLNSSVRVPKMDHVAAPQYSSRATENWGLIVYHEWALLHNKDVHSSDSKAGNIMTAVHEMSHQWFGNLVSPAWWKYYWLSEGIATYFKYYITDMMYNELRLNELFVVFIQHELAFNADDRDNVVPINKDFTSPQDIMHRNSAIIYGKSASIVRMLSHIITESVFRAGLLKYIAANEYSSVTSDDLWAAMQDALTESNAVHNNINVKKVMDSWVEQTGYPLVTVTRNQDTGDVVIYQEPSPTNRDLRYKRWWIPISYATKSQPNFTHTSPSDWLTPGEERIVIRNVPMSDWIIVNIQEAGYYRVNYDEASWTSIAEYLNSEDYTKIHVINRAKIIADAYEMLKENRLNPHIFLNLTNYLSREIDYIPWISAVRILNGISKYLQDPEGAALANPYILYLINNYIESIGYDERPEDTPFVKSARPQILTWACALGHEACRRKATARLIAYIENPIENKISVELKYPIFCTGLIEANQTIWDKLFELTNYTMSYRSFRYLGCSENPSIINNYLNMVFSNETILSGFDFVSALENLNRYVLTNTDVELDFIINNWDRLSQTDFHPDDILNIVIQKINTEDQFDKLLTFLEMNGIDKYTDLAYRREAVGRIREDIARVRVWLENASVQFN